MPGLFPVCVHHVYKMKCVYLRLTVYCTHIRVVQEARRNLRHCVLPGHMAPTLAFGIDTGTGTGTGTGTDTVALPREYVCVYTLW